MTRALALQLLRSYPPAWRERYEAEVRALIDDAGVRVRDLAELFRGLITERVRELLTSAENPKRTAAALGLVKPAAMVLFMLAALALGLILRLFTGPWSPDARQWGAVVFQLFFVSAMCVSFFTRRRPWGSHDQSYPAWVGAVLLPALFVLVVLAVAGQFSMSDEYSPEGTKWMTRNQHWLNLLIYSTWILDVSSSVWPGRRLLHAFLQLQGAEQQFKASEAWVASCREWIAKGVPSPVADAERQVAVWTASLDLARERVHALGYRARFRQDVSQS